MEYEYIVYKTTNLINNKIYIGVHKTQKGITDSYIGCGIWKNTKPTRRYAFHKAVSKYGYENFKRETLYTFPDTYNGEREAYKKEAELVTRDFIRRKDVYNMCLGGIVPSSVNEKPVAQYDLDGNFIKVWNSMSEASEFAPSQSISECCIRKTFSKEWQWRYYTGDTSNIKPAKIRTKGVYQFDLNGNYITYYKSLHEASRITGVPYQVIGGNCLNKQASAGGYFWSYKKQFEYNPDKVKKSAVACYTDEGKFIKSFTTLREASEEYHVSHSCILRCIQGKTKHAGKVRWKYFYGDTSDISSL